MKNIVAIVSSFLLVFYSYSSDVVEYVSSNLKDNISNVSIITETVNNNDADDDELLSEDNNSKINADQVINGMNDVIRAEVSDDQTICKVQVVTGTRYMNISAAVWSLNGGQDDIIWYPLSLDNESYNVNIPIVNHKSYGTYAVHIYAKNFDSSDVFIGSSNFEISKPMIKAFYADNWDADNGTFDIKIDGINSVSGISSIILAVWTANNGQDDICWYSCEAKKMQDNLYYASLKESINNHFGEYGLYKIHTYVTSMNGICILAETQYSIEMQTGDLICKKNSEQTAVDITFKNVGIPTSWSVIFGIWSEANGQDDLVWHTNSKRTENDFSTTCYIKDHKTSGKYFVQAYIVNSSGTRVQGKLGTFEISEPKVESMLVTDINISDGYFDVSVTGIDYTCKAYSATFAVWTANGGQDDIKWETVIFPDVNSFDNNFSYRVFLNDHKYELGIYKVHMYLTFANQINILKQTSQNITYQCGDLFCKPDSMEMNCSVELNDLEVPNSWSVMFAVWSVNGGQDDLKWYDSYRENNNFISNISILNHKTKGVYNVHAYLFDSNDEIVSCLKESTFEIGTASCDSIAVDEVSFDKDLLSIDANNIISKSGISKITFAVWSEPGGQDDIEWSEGDISFKKGVFYAKCSQKFSNHNFYFGVYKVHIYAELGNGIVDLIYMGNVDISSDCEANASISSDENYIEVSLKSQLFSKNTHFDWAVWSVAGGQDDLKWYTPTWENNKFLLNVPIINHRSLGIYNIHMYYKNNYGVEEFLLSIQVDYQTAAFVNYHVLNVDGSTGLIDVGLDDVNIPSGISSFSVAAWKTNVGVSSAVYYNPEMISPSFYKYAINVENHQLYFGNYSTDCHIEMGNGIVIYLGKLTVDIQPLNYFGVSYTGNGVFKAVALNFQYSNIDKVQFPTWSVEKGQDDIVWYETSTPTTSDRKNWEYNILIGKHMPAGLHKTHLYVYVDGKAILCLQKEYNVTEEQMSLPIYHGIRTGVDVSEWQNYINWNAVVASNQIGYAMLRIGYGVGNVDIWWETNYTNARSAGLPVGGYWYSYARSPYEAAQEAETCIASLGGRHMDLPIAFDLEQHSDLDVSTNTAMINAFCSRIAAAGYCPMVYSSESWFNGKFNVYGLDGNIYFWVAQWSHEPEINRKEMMRMWQTGSKGSVPGIPGEVDMDYFYY